MLSAQLSKYFLINFAKFFCFICLSYSYLCFYISVSYFSAILAWLYATQSSYFFVDLISTCWSNFGGLTDLKWWGWGDRFYFIFVGFGELSLNYLTSVGTNFNLLFCNYYSNFLCNYSKFGTYFGFIGIPFLFYYSIELIFYSRDSSSLSNYKEFLICFQ